MTDDRRDEGASPATPEDARPEEEVDLPLPLLRRGKVREMYDASDHGVPDGILMVASDRISAFDVVLPQPIPDKGEVLTRLTAWWLSRVEDLVHHHLITADADEIVRRIPDLEASREVWAGRSLLVHRAEPVPIECVVRGYITGSAWEEYRQEGTLAGEPLPEGLVESEELDEPIFSPATKAEAGHDENVTFQEVGERVGEKLAAWLRERSLSLYRRGARIARERGIIVADTKFEFGVGTDDGRLLLIDEVLTPDSSRFWPAEEYEPGRSQPSLDKQPVRDWLDGLEDWDKSPPPPDLPAEVVEATTARYREIFARLTGRTLDEAREEGA